MTAKSRESNSMFFLCRNEVSIPTAVDEYEKRLDAILSKLDPDDKEFVIEMLIHQQENAISNSS